MFDIDTFISDCVACIDEAEPRRAVRDVLARTMAGADQVADRFRPDAARINMLYGSPQLSIFEAVWAPGMAIWAHDHRMWAAIGVFTGREDNSFFRRPPAGEAGLVESGHKQLEIGDVTLLGDDTIHSVSTPADRPTGAIHVYGGDFVNQRRSQWLPPELSEEPYDLDRTRSVFASANEEWMARR